MKNKQSDILLVEDDNRTAKLYKYYLRREPINLIHVETGKDALNYLQKAVPQVLLIDLGLPDMNGLEIVKYAKKNQLNCILIVITAEDSIDVVVDVMRNGVFDFIKKPFKPNRLVTTLRQVIEIHHSDHCFIPSETQEFIGNSSAMQEVYKTIKKVAKSKASVFITGETGTGKELCAQAIHKNSQRWDKPFIILNCASIVRDLMESELFGHVKGAFTGAEKNREGAVSSANGGTLFLDEIGELDLDLQQKLLRFLQQGTFQKVGTNHEESVDVRVVCATNRNPQAEIYIGRFRSDLYFRLNAITIQLPPLCERDDDVLVLARTFLNRYSIIEQKRFKDFTPKAKKILTEYQWPGNVRQLQNVIHNVVLLNEGEMITPKMLHSKLNTELLYSPPSDISDDSHTSQKKSTVKPSVNVEPVKPIKPDKSVKPDKFSINIIENDDLRSFREIEREIIMKAMKFCEDNVVKTADLLEISKSAIYNKLEKWNKDC
ncbi:sigma-54 dependent transcriptional regulator [Candidatus Halobeggiatoa sp. HSG11]|nr:sigma-54 dependent transcriptional regulator [Candidatus Halobeggiatoa sp. HSG11]